MPIPAGPPVSNTPANVVVYGNPGTLYGTPDVEYGDGNYEIYPLSDRWSVDGFPLQTFAYNISSWGGSRQSPPPFRGDDVLIPHRPGKRWLPKQVDSRTITLGMWVVGAAQDGTIPTNTTMRRMFERNWRMLRKLLWTPDREIALTKIFYDDDDLIRTATAQAQFAGGLEPSMNGRTRASFTVDLTLADPFFYSSRTLYTMTLPGTPTVAVPAQGDVPTDTVKLTFTGPLTNPRVTNQSLPDGDIWVQYAGSLAGGETLTLDCRNFTAEKNPGGTKQVGLIQHYGNYSWMKASQFSNNFALSATAGTGSCSVEIVPAWL